MNTPKHTGGILWFTGLSGAGKTTLANALASELRKSGVNACILDGDVLRKGLCKDLGFSLPDRHENIRRASCVARLMAEAGLIVIASFITPTEKDRTIAQENSGGFYRSIYVEATLDICESRDVKGLYKLARAGKIAEFTGISSPYEPPTHSNLTLHSGQETIQACTEQLLAFIHQEFIDIL